MGLHENLKLCDKVKRRIRDLFKKRERFTKKRPYIKIKKKEKKKNSCKLKRND